MEPRLTKKEEALIRETIRNKYSQVAAASPGSYFRYPTGAEGLRRQRYPLDLMRDFPKSLIESFCGVGNPFSLGPIHPGEAVLDIGCGAGLDTLLAAKMVGPEGRVAGLDATPGMIEKARAHAALLALPNVTFQVGEAESLPFPDNDFDVIISNGVFNLTLDKEKALKESHRVLKPGGRFMLADMVLVAALPPEKAGKIENWYQ
ncbi:MAG: methyltransferase domain-containing protein [Syntrophales bacterium]|nr:methyltransferase domain-containing protein [Syntrophales bacterium]